MLKFHNYNRISLNMQKRFLMSRLNSNNEDNSLNLYRLHVLRKQQTEAGLLICEGTKGVQMISTLPVDASSAWIPYQFNMTLPFKRNAEINSIPGLACSTVPARHVLK